MLLSISQPSVRLSGQALLDMAKWPSILREGVGQAACFLSLAHWVAAGRLCPSDRCSPGRPAWGSGTVALGKWEKALRQISASSSSADQRIQEGRRLWSRKQYPNQGTRKGGASPSSVNHTLGAYAAGWGTFPKTSALQCAEQRFAPLENLCRWPRDEGRPGWAPVSFSLATPSVWHLLLFPTNFLAAPGPGRHLKRAMG